MKKIVTYDIGGTYTKYALFNTEGEMLEKNKIETVSGTGFSDFLVEHIRMMVQKESDIVGISIGMPGIIKDNHLIKAANLGIENLAIVENIVKQFNLPALLCNDANLAALGESVFGLKKENAHMMLVTIGTGIGSGLVLGNHIFEGYRGGFGELGHIVVEDNGRPCQCGNKGCLEMYCSSKGILLNYKEITGENAVMDDFIVNDSKDHLASLEQAAKYLGQAIANTVTLLDLEDVIIGGGISENRYLIERIRYWYNYYVIPYISDLEIHQAKLGNDAALYGAYIVIMRKLNIRL